MMKKTCLCIVGLLFLGMLCVPVMAIPHPPEPGYWNFDIINDAKALSVVKLNGDVDDFAEEFYQRVYVSDADDQVEVKIEVTAGPDTTLKITKDYITTLRNKCQGGWEPTLVTYGGFATYDVDAICIETYTRVPSTSTVRMHAGKVIEHLKKRGLAHNKIGSTHYYEDYYMYERFAYI